MILDKTAAKSARGHALNATTWCPPVRLSAIGIARRFLRSYVTHGAPGTFLKGSRSPHTRPDSAEGQAEQRAGVQEGQRCCMHSRMHYRWIFDK